MYTSYVVDDESHAIDTLVGYIEKYSLFSLLGSSTNPVEALEAIKSLKPHITFMDVHMPELSGLDLADLVSGYTKVIFTTAHMNYAVDAFDKNLTDFLLKPISFQRFLKSVKKAEEQLMASKEIGPIDTSDELFYVNPGVRGKLLKFKFSDILYIEGLKNYVILHTAASKHITYLTMSEVERALPASVFFRVHKSFIINLQYLKTIEGPHVTLTNGAILALGGMHKEALNKHISSKILRSARSNVDFSLPSKTECNSGAVKKHNLISR